MTSTLNRNRVCKAISQKHLLRFSYTDKKVRVVEPHLAAENAAHHETLLAWVLRRENIDQTRPGGWRNYLIEEMRSVEILAETFDGPRPDYNPNDSRLLRVYCSLALLVRVY